MVDVQQRLRLVLDADAVLGLVVLGERTEMVVREGRARVQLLTDLGHVEELTTDRCRGVNQAKLIQGGERKQQSTDEILTKHCLKHRILRRILSNLLVYHNTASSFSQKPSQASPSKQLANYK